MKQFIFFFFVTSFFVSQSFAAPIKGDSGVDRARLANCRSIESTVKLSNGRIANLPLCVADSKVWATYYLVPYDKAEKYLAPYGVYPIKMNGAFAFMQLALIDYKISTLGPYLEVTLNFWTSRTAGTEGTTDKFMELMANFPGAPVKDHGLFALKLWVDHKKPLLAGNEIWGSNKTMAKITYTENNGGVQLQMNNRKNESILAVEWKAIPTGAIPGFFDTNSYVGLPGLGAGPLFSQAQTWGTVQQMDRIAPDQLKVKADPNDPFGAIIEDLTKNGLPVLLRYVPDYQLIYSRPSF
jgi:hypothetical protein